LKQLTNVGEKGEIAIKDIKFNVTFFLLRTSRGRNIWELEMIQYDEKVRKQKQVYIIRKFRNHDLLF
jgi:hypothetical protein